MTSRCPPRNSEKPKWVSSASARSSTGSIYSKSWAVTDGFQLRSAPWWGALLTLPRAELELPHQSREVREAERTPLDLVAGKEFFDGRTELGPEHSQDSRLGRLIRGT
jgi:hypothetical protein